MEGRLTLLTMWKRCVSFLERERYVVVTSCVCAWWTELKTNECEAFGEVYKRSSTRGLRCSSVWAECNGEAVECNALNTEEPSYCLYRDLNIENAKRY